MEFPTQTAQGAARAPRLWGSVLLALLVGSIAGRAAGPVRPNFVFILIDDLGWSHVGCYGSDFFETPRIDRLAAEGMRFTAAYAACTVCSPTRASLMTGKYPGRLRITHAIPIEGHRRLKNPPLRDADYVKNMPLEEVTIAEALKEAGYATGYFGKWHCCWEAPYYPEHQGFDVNVGGNNMGNPGNYFSPYNGKWRMTEDDPWVEWNTLPGGPPSEYLTDRLTEEAVRFIAAPRTRPFLLYLAHYAVHTPLQARPEKVARYRAKPKDTARGHTNPIYAAMLESVDESVGRILDALAQHGLSENTIVIFTSDNGGAHHSSNHPWRGNKGNFYEGGIRVPAIVKWPGIVRAGSTSDAVIISPDFYPTLLEMAGLPPRPQQHLDGVSLVPTLRETNRLTREAIYWHFPNYLGGLGIPEAATPCSVVRYGDWKLIESLEDGRVELFDLARDPRESTDAAPRQPRLVGELRALLKRHREEIQAQYPRPWPGQRR